MSDKVQGIVIQTVRYGDTSLIVKVFTQGFGLKSYMVKGAFNRSSKNRAAFFQPLSIINYVEVGKPNGNALGYLKDVQLEYNYQTLPLEMNKSAIMMYVSELLSKTLAGQEQNDDLYFFMVKSLQWLDLVESGFGNFPLFFTLELTRFLGFYPKPGYSEGFCFDMMEGLFAHDYPLHPYYLDASVSVLLHRLLGKGIEEACRVPLNVNQRRELMDGLIVFMRLHAPVMKDFQSHEVLKSVLQ